MQLIQAISHRRSVRHYSDQVVPDDALRLLVEAANCAPSASNAYAWSICIVQDTHMIEKIRAVSPGILGEPRAILVLCIDRVKSLARGGTTGRDFHGLMDVAHAAQNICLQATDLGIGSVCVRSFHSGALAALLGLPESMTADYLVALGYPKDRIVPRCRRSVDEAIHGWWREAI